jgi:hypothetical protein
MAGDIVDEDQELAGLRGLKARARLEARPTVEQMREWLRYEPDTGRLFWIIVSGGRGRGYPRDKEVRGHHPSGYSFIELNGYKYGVHRVAWALGTGEWQPDGLTIDHINGVRSDNRLANLRLATKAQNRMNSPSARNGVRLHLCGKWEARISVDKRYIYLGLFSTREEAKAVRDQAAIKLHGEFACLT